MVDDAERDEEACHCGKPAAAFYYGPDGGAGEPRCEDHWVFRTRQPGDTAWFEYHCHQGHDSADAAAWYRSRQQVMIVERNDTEIESAAFVYKVRFADGLQWTAFEDELHDSPAEFGTQAETLGGFAPPSWREIEQHDSEYAAWARANGHNA